MNNLENKKYWIWFSLIENLGSARGKILLEKFKKPEKIYYVKKEELKNIKGIGEKIIENIMNKQTKEKVNKHIEYMEKNNIDLITI